MAEPPKLFRRLYRGPYEPTASPLRLYDEVRGTRSVVQRMRLMRTLPVHNGCVNSISWSEHGEFILSGSDDQKLCITDSNCYKVLASIQTGHRANIFAARFLPNSDNKKIISCSGDGLIMFTDLERPENFSNCFNCHFGTTYKIVTIPDDPNCFLSCGEDGTVRCFDLRRKQHCTREECREDILINCRRAVTALTVNPITNYQLVLGCSNSFIQIYDRRMLETRNSGSLQDSVHCPISNFTVPAFAGRSHRITSLTFSKDAEELLASFSSDYIYLFRLQSHLSGQSVLLTNERKRVAPLPVKRLRLRGDWSDTGPNARPERELRDDRQQTLQASLMQRMSDVLTRMLMDSPRRAQRTETNVAASREAEEASESQETAVNVEATSPAIDIETPEPLSMDTADSINELINIQAEVDSSLSSPPSAVIEIDESQTEQTVVDEVETEVSVNDPSQTSFVNVVGSSVDESDQGAVSNVSEQMESSESNQNVDASNISSSPMNVFPKSSVEHCSFSEPEEEEISGIKKVLKSRRKQLLKKHKMEPTVSLHYNARGVSSGVISMNHPSTSLPTLNYDEQTTSSVPLQRNVSEKELFDSEMDSPFDNDHSFKDRKPSDDEKNPLQSETLTDQMTSSDPKEGVGSSSLTETEEEQNPSGISEYNECFANVRSSASNSCKEEIESVPSSAMPCILRKYVGHRNARTMIKEANFWGDNFIVSGSDCGHIFFWDRHTEEVAMILEADRHVVNCVQPHPFDPVLASSGIDYDVKLWAPLHEEPSFDEKTAKVIMLRNEVMLEETRDTITVPASFMIRMLASLSHLRSGNRNQRNSEPSPQ